jgi:hypothetical protein
MKRSNCRSTAALIGTCAALALASGAGVAHAGVVIDLRAISKNGIATPNPKLVAVAPGDTVIFRVFADVTGAAGNIAPDCLQSVSGSFLSTGGIRGNLSLDKITLPFDEPQSSVGATQDLDGDGDLDVGSNDNASPPGSSSPGRTASPVRERTRCTAELAPGAGSTQRPFQADLNTASSQRCA